MRTKLEGRRPLVGDLVIYFPGNVDEKAKNNGADYVPAIITQSWGELHGGCANLKILHDDSGVLWRTSVSHAMDPLQPQSDRFVTGLNAENSCWIYKEEFDEIFKQIQKRSDEDINSDDEEIRMSAYSFNIFQAANQWFSEQFAKT